LQEPVKGIWGLERWNDWVYYCQVRGLKLFVNVNFAKSAAFVLKCIAKIDLKFYSLVKRKN